MAEVAGEGRCDVAGVVDQTQVNEVFEQWRTNGVSGWKIPLLAAVLGKAPFAGKPSTRWTPDGVHDFMHAKCVVADDVAFVGSFNLSRSGERNAENVLELHSRPLADALAAYVDAVHARYPRATVPA
jgi:phosphatidylserine/phosphatidylglycerophosphate/cardiolipin synthase-like enzyme